MRLSLGIAIAGFALLANAVAARAQPLSLDDLTTAVVQVRTHINPDGRTVQTLGLERQAPASLSARTGWC